MLSGCVVPNFCVNKSDKTPGLSCKDDHDAKEGCKWRLEKHIHHSTTYYKYIEYWVPNLNETFRIAPVLIYKTNDNAASLTDSEAMFNSTQKTESATTGNSSPQRAPMLLS